MKITITTLAVLLGAAQAKGPIARTPPEDAKDNNPPFPAPWAKEFDGKIVGGQNAVEDAYPFQVLFSYSSSAACCGGSLIAPDVVLTAAHCEGCGTKVHIGKHSLSGDSSTDFETISVTEVKPHPNYNPSTINNDFMLLRLASPATMGEVIKIDDGTLSPSYASGQRLDLTGWGQTSGGAGGPIPDILQHGEFGYLTNSQCAAYWGSYITDKMMCIYEDNMSGCMGDSGGPLFDETAPDGPVQVGVVSWGTQSCSGYPSVFARISSEISWINSVLADWSGNPAPSPPAPSPGTCTDKPGWVDSYGDGCEWYEANDSPGCPNYGDYFDGGMGTPNEACCHCGGGDSAGPTPTPPAPTPPAPTPPAPTPPAPTTPTPPAPSPPTVPTSDIEDAIGLIEDAIGLLEEIV